MKVPVLIVGGGVSGLAAAYQLPGSHLIIEKNPTAGGMAGTIDHAGFSFDFTGHLLHFHDPATTELIKGLLGDNIQKHERSAWIYSHGVYSRYPYQVNTYNLPERVKQECIDGLIEAHKKLKPKASPRQTFAEWAVTTFGMGFCKHFFFPYNRKLWQTDPVNMTAEWVGQFVPRPSVDDVMRGAKEDYRAEFGYNASFYYPKTGGMQNLVNGFLEKGEIDIRYNTTLVSLNAEDHVANVRGPDGIYSIEYDHLISTIPMPELLKRVTDLPKKNQEAVLSTFKWTTLVCLNIGVNDSRIGGGKHWVYFPEEKYPFYRVGFSHNFSSTIAPKDCGSLYVEVPFPGGKNFTATEMSAVVFKCTDALKECKILKSTDQIVTIRPEKIPYAYVIYTPERTPLVTGFTADLNTFDIYPTGRYGSWRYSFMEKDIQDATAVAQSLIDTSA